MQLGYFPYRNRVPSDPDYLALAFDLGPNMFQIYPEYLTDPSIILCPSDPEFGRHNDDLRHEDPNNDFRVDRIWPADKRASAVDASYTYMGWVMDRYGYSYGYESTAAIMQLMTLVGEDDRIPSDPPDEGASQVVATLESMVVEFTPQYLADSREGVARVADSDITMIDQYQGMGNGGMNTVYRFREGIERFLVTDINNPAASAMAQSTLPIMFDHIAYVPSMFNHVPGGANILYMDGHVAFERYIPESEGVCNRYVANVLGLLALSL